MRFEVAKLVTCLLALSVTSSGQRGISGNPEDVRIVNGILSRDRSAIVDAGNSRNSQFVPSLKRVLGELTSKREKLSSEDSFTRAALRDSLVKLEDRQTQQQYWCWLIHETVDTPVVALRAIGGWFSIQALDAVLSGAGEAAFARAIHGRPPSDDLTRVSPRYAALSTLPELISTGPQVSKLDTNASQVWREWIRAHRGEFQSLEPRGVGVVFTEDACRSVSVEDW
jgi:hypothetical protein